MTRKKLLLHNISGLTLPQYNELRELFRSGERIWQWSGEYDLKKALGTVLYHRESYRKLRSLAQVLAMLMRPKHLPIPSEAYLAIQDLRAGLEGSLLYKLRDTPIGNPKVWRKNKAGLMKLVDDKVCKFISIVFPENSSMLKLVDKNRERWASKRMPGSGSMKRGRPKKRDRSSEKRPYDTLLVRIDGMATMPLSRRDLKSYAHSKVEILKDPREVRR